MQALIWSVSEPRPSSLSIPKKLFKDCFHSGQGPPDGRLPPESTPLPARKNPQYQDQIHMLKG